MDIRVLLEFDKDVGQFSATCPELNFVSSCGDSREQAIANLKEAIHLLLTPIPEHLLETHGHVESLQIAL